MSSRPGRVLTHLVLALALALCLPAVALAADPPTVTVGDGGAATVLVVLLLGSLTAGLFFASPLRRRMPRGTFASTNLPSSVTRSRAAAGLERGAAHVHDALARRTRNWPQLRTRRPLPPMLGGDIFVAGDPAPSRGSTAVGARDPAPRTSDEALWSTAPIGADERYLPSR